LIPCDPLTKLFDNAHWLVANHETWRDRVFASHDMEVSSTDGGQGHPDYCFTRSSSRFLNLFNPDIVLAVKNIGLHFLHPSTSGL
jgi:hypothetical protein